VRIERRSTHDATRSARSSERARRARESSQRMCPYVYVSSAEVGRRRRPKETCVRTSLGDPEVEPTRTGASAHGRQLPVTAQTVRSLRIRKGLRDPAKVTKKAMSTKKPSVGMPCAANARRTDTGSRSVSEQGMRSRGSSTEGRHLQAAKGPDASRRTERKRSWLSKPHESSTAERKTARSP